MIHIRELTAEDASAFHALRYQLDEETHFMMLAPGERTTTPEQVRAYLQGVFEADNQVCLGALDEEHLVGYISLSGGRYQRIRHCATIVVGVLQAYAGQGLGTRLFEQGIAWARSRHLTRLELTVMTHNHRAVHLYRKMGFELEGTKKHAMLVDGQYVDEYCMALLLEEDPA